MASSSSLHLLLFCSLLFPIISLSQAQSFRPKALVLPITKDASTLQYTTHITQRTPPVPTKLTIDLGNDYLWVDCEKDYKSTTKTFIPCRSARCNLLSPGSACTAPPNPSEAICVDFPYNEVIRTSTSGEVAQDKLYIQSTNGFNPGRVVSISNFIFTCAPSFLLEGLANGVSLPSQFAASFSFTRKFAICLNPSDGAIIFGSAPYIFNFNMSNSLTYTPLLQNPIGTGGTISEGKPSSDYFIGVKSIKVNNAKVSLNTTLLSINKEGFGGTKLSTIQPYTVLESSIYKAVSEAFVKAVNKSTIAPVKPFGTCFASKDISSSRMGYSVPNINLVLDSEKVVWTIMGSNSMVRAGDEAVCLAFVDGGLNRRTSIVLGGFQLENYLVEFDLARSRVGFTSMFLSHTNCANFNFTFV
ncbi:hypothetical protein UlMin_009370 [Ulmus minor]